MTAEIQTRPPGLTVLGRPGNHLTFTLEFPADYLDGKTWTVTAGGVALSVQIVGDTMTVPISGATTAALGSGIHPLLFTDTTGEDQVRIAGQLQLGNKTADVTDLTVTVTVADVVPVEITVTPGEPGVPAGGDTGQVLAKASDDDYDSEWVDVLTSTDLDAEEAARIAADDLLDGRVTTVEDTLPLKADLVAGTVPDAQIPSSITRGSELTAAVTAAVNALLDGAPGALDTLNELAAAVNDDASFAATVTTALAGKQPLDADLTTLAAGGSGATSWLTALLNGTYAQLLQQGTTLGDSSIVGVDLVVDVETHWGIHLGVPYYEEDPGDVTPGEEAILHVDETGAVTWVLLTDVEAKDTAVEVETAARIAAAAAHVAAADPHPGYLTPAEGTAAYDAIGAAAAAQAAAATDATTKANAAQAAAVQRANHTGTQLASTISDFAEAVDDRVGPLFAGDSADLDFTYDDSGNAEGAVIKPAVLSTFMRTVTDDADAPTARATLGVVPTGVAAWAATTTYEKGQLVTHLGSMWMANAAFTSGSTFDPANWTLVRPGGFGFPCSVDVGQMRTADVLAMVANDSLYLRTRDGGTISKIGLLVTNTSGNISLSAYRNSGEGRSAIPADRLATTGAIACPTAGTYTEVSLGSTVTLLPGDWLSLSCDNATATFRSSLASAVDINLGLGRQFRQATAHPSPQTPASLVATLGRPIVLIGVP